MLMPFLSGEQGATAIVHVGGSSWAVPFAQDSPEQDQAQLGLTGRVPSLLIPRVQSRPKLLSGIRFLKKLQMGQGTPGRGPRAGLGVPSQVRHCALK